MQNVLSMAVDTNKDRDSWPKFIERRVDEAEERLKKELREGIEERLAFNCSVTFTILMQARESSRSRLRHDLLQILLKADHPSYAEASPDGGTSPRYRRLEEQPLFIRSSSLLQKSKALLADCDIVITQTAKGGESIDIIARFKEEHDRMTRAIRLGEKVINTRTRCLLGFVDDEGEWALGRAEESDEASGDVRAVLNAGRRRLDITDQQGGETWGEVAQNVMEASEVLSRIAKGAQE